MIHENPSLSFFEAINASTKKIFQFTDARDVQNFGGHNF